MNPRVATTVLTPRRHDPIANDAGRPSSVIQFRMVPLTNVCTESKSSPRLNCVESATCVSQQ